jgi:hypothetical protein
VTQFAHRRGQPGSGGTVGTGVSTARAIADPLAAPVRLRLVSSPTCADRPYPQHSVVTSRALRALDLIFDGVGAVTSVARVLRQTFGHPGVTDHKFEKWAESAARHPSAQGLKATTAPVLRVVTAATKG